MGLDGYGKRRTRAVWKKTERQRRHNRRKAAALQFDYLTIDKEMEVFSNCATAPDLCSKVVAEAKLCFINSSV